MSKTSVAKSVLKVSIKGEEDTILTSDKFYYYTATGNWRNVIFIPYNMLWKTFIVFTVICNCLLVSYYIAFEGNFSNNGLPFYYTFELVYFLNTVLVLTHRYMLPYQKTKTHVPINLARVIVDVISFLPYYEFYYLLIISSKGRNYEVETDYFKMKVMLRLQTVYAYFSAVANEPGLQHILVAFINQFIACVLICVFGSSVWFLLKYKNVDVNWTKNLKYFKINESSGSNLFVLSSSFVIGLFKHNYSGVIFSTNGYETSILLSVMIIGFFMHRMLFFGRLTALYMKEFGLQYEFSSRVVMINKLIDNWQIDTPVKKEAINYYKQFWERRMGMRRMPKAFFTLPLSMQREPCVDIFWHALRHSHFFADVDISFKRYLCINMTCEFFVPGEYLYRYNKPKTKLMYIVSGVVQILSQEDQVSSVMSFSSGTLLGETMCLMCVNSTINMRCATYCEVHSLDLLSLCRILSNFRSIAQSLHERMGTRILLAKTLQNQALLKLKDREQKRTSIRWIKNQWRNVARYTKSKKLIEDTHKQVTPAHISKYLDLYVLSDDVELKVKAICLNSKCPFVMDPSSSFHQFCYFLVLGATITQSIFLPYILFFRRTLTPTEYGFVYCLDIIYLFGLYLEVSTAVNVKNHLISNFFQIIIYKSKQITTLIDIASTLPIELIVVFSNYSAHTKSFMHINRVLKIYKLFQLIRIYQLNIWISFMKIRLIKYSVAYVVSIYFISCLIYGVTCFDVCEKFGWFQYDQDLKSKFNRQDALIENVTPFVNSLGYTISMMLAIRDKLIYAYNIRDIIIEMFVVSFGYYIFSFCYSELAACTILQQQTKNRYQEYLIGLRHFVVRKNIPQHLRNVMYNIVQCEWQYNYRNQITGKNSIFKDLPQNIKNKVILSRIVDCFKKSQLFSYFSDETIWKIAGVAKLTVLPPNTTLIREETFYPIINVLLRGYCKVASSIPTDKYHGSITQLSYGDTFPAIESLLKINSFINVTSMTFVEIITVKTCDLMVILKDIPEFYNDLCFVLEEELRKHSIILTRQKGRLPEMVPSQKAYGKGDFFVYETNELYNAESYKYTYIKSFLKLGKWRYIRPFIMRKCITPTNNIYIIWECTRCTLSFIQILYSLFFMRYDVTTPIHTYIERFFQVVAAIDFYIRMHCCYYDQNGILVTHPFYTAKHYFKTSFVLDLYCVFPVEDLRLHHMFGSNYKKHALLFMHLVTRPMLFHRFFNGLSYFQYTIRDDRAALVHYLKYTLLVGVVISASSTLLKAGTCSLDSENTCRNDSWISASVYGTNLTRLKIDYICFYNVLNIYSGSSVGLFRLDSFYDSLLYFFFVVTMCCLRWFVLAKITCSDVGGNTMLVRYQHNMKVFLNFTKRWNINNELVAETVRHCEYVWKRTNGHRTNKILNSFHPVLKAEYSNFLYASALKLADAFSGMDDSGLRYLTSYFAEIHFKKHTEIIRCNDVQEYIYVVYKGRVVISVANDKLCTLTTGGMFGCLSERTITRQTIKATAVIHVDVLAIKSKTFNRIINQYPSVKQKIRRAKFLNDEYLLPTSTVKTHAVDPKLSDVAYTGRLATVKNFIVNSNRSWFRAYNYAVNVHLASATSLLAMTLIVGIGNFNIVNYWYIMNFFDIIFLGKIFLAFHSSYIDYESGIEVRKLSKIWRRYLKSFNGFFFDVFTCLPLEWIGTFVDPKNETVYSLCWSNRILRLFFMIKYYNTCKNKLTVSKHLRWTYLLYTATFLIHIMVCAWYILACHRESCSYRPIVSSEAITFNTTQNKDSWKAFSMSYIYVLNIFTTTGLRNIAPRTTTEFVLSMFMICVSQLATLGMTAEFATLLVLENCIMNDYERLVLMVINFTVVSDMSPSLKSKIWKYFCEKWTKSNGSWMPVLLKTLPSYLREDIMTELYMKHLLTHTFFAKTHKDFLRQLVVHLQVYEYLPDQYIAEKGDIDDSMYFIDKGEVVVYDKQGNNEFEQVVLMDGMSFGERQGLYSIPHESSYKARFACRILVLRRQEWQYLLKWFPASSEQIENHMKECRWTNFIIHY